MSIIKEESDQEENEDSKSVKDRIKRNSRIAFRQRSNQDHRPHWLSRESGLSRANKSGIPKQTEEAEDEDKDNKLRSQYKKKSMNLDI